jgi:hypothetical protein
MKIQHKSALSLLFGVSIGAGLGYAGALLAAGATTPLLSRPTGDAFNQLFLGIGRLGALEIAAAQCSGRMDGQLILKEEGELIPNIRGAAHAQGLNPPLEVAEAILAIRNEGSAREVVKEQVQARREKEIQNLLKGAGWGNESFPRIQETVTRLAAC